MDYRKNDKNGLKSSNRSKNEGLYDTFQIRDALNESFDLSKITVSESLIQMTLQKARLQNQGMNRQNSNVQDQEVNIQNEKEQGQGMSTEYGFAKNHSSNIHEVNSENGRIYQLNPEQQQEHKDIKKKKTNFYQLGLAAACVGLLFIGALALKDQDFNFTLGSSKKDSATQEYVSETAESSSYDDVAATDESTASADQATEKADVAQDYSVAAAGNEGEESSNALESEATADTAQAKDSSLGEQKSEDVQTDTFIGASEGSLKNDIFRIQTEDMDITISPEEIASIRVYDAEETLIQDMTAEEEINAFYKKLGSIEGNSTDSYNTEQYERHYVISAKTDQAWKELHIWAKDSLRCQVTSESGQVIESSFIPTNPSNLEGLSN